MGPKDFSTVEASRSLVNPAARPRVNMPTSTAASRAISGEPTTSAIFWTWFSGSSTTMSTSALTSIRTTGSRTVATVAPKLGRLSVSSEGRFSRVWSIRSGGWMSTQRAA